MSDDEIRDDSIEEETTPVVEPVEEQTEIAKPSGDEEKKFEFVEDPVFDVDYKGECAYEVKVTIPVANEKKMAGDQFEELRHEVEVPGFRKGRAPLKLVERKFAKAVKNEVRGKLVQAAFLKLLDDKDLSPASKPEVDGFDKDDQRGVDDPIVFTLKFEVQPRVELAKYRGVEVERPIYTVSDADVDAAIVEMAKRFSVFEALEDGEVMDGDQVIITFRGTIDGEEFPGGAAENYPYIMGTRRFFPEFEPVLLGKRPGDTVTCEVLFADSYSVEHLRGREAVFEIRINDLKRRSRPEVNEEFALQAGFETVADMRLKLAARLQEGAMADSNEIAQYRVLKSVLDACTFELPKSLLENLTEEFYQGAVKELRDKRMPQSMIEARDAELRAQAQLEATHSMKSWSAMREIAEAEGIEATDEDFEQEAAVLSRRSGASMEAVAKFLGDEENRGTYERRILHAKVLASLMAHAIITDKEVTREELDKADEDEEAPED